MFRRLFKNEKGFSLIEVLIGMLILGMIAATFIGGMNTVLTTSFRNSRQVHALALAQSQIEYIKQQDYNDEAVEYTENEETYYVVKYIMLDDADIPTGYTIYGWNETITTENGNKLANFAEFWTIPPYDEDNPEGEPSTTDTGLQKICVVIKHQSSTEPVITLYGFKVDREFPQE